MTGFEVLTEGLAFPEGPAVARDGAVWLSELRGGAIVRLDDRGGRRTYEVGGAPNGLAHANDGSVWFCDQSANLVRRLDPNTGEAETVVAELDGEPLAAPNDLAFLPDGSLLFTCPGDSRDVPTGSVCRLGPGGEVARVATGLRFPNGICVTDDGARIYVAETYARRVSVAAPRTPMVGLALEAVFETPGPIGADGVAVTREGLVATCVHGAGMVRLFDPASGSVRDEPTPDARPAGCAADPLGRWSLIVTGTEHGVVLGVTL